MAYNKKRIGWSFIVVIGSLLATVYTLGDIAMHPGTMLHELGGDAIKNYYTFLQHSLHGNGWWFKGINYPYGENLMFVDAQPALSLLLTKLRAFIPLTASHVTRVMNLLLCTAFFLAIIYTYKILGKFAVNRVWALVLSCLIVCFSSINMRIFGLYGLAYACVLPMLFYWYICYNTAGHLRYMAYILLLTCIAMFLHPYHLATTLVWTALYCLGYPLTKQLTFKHKLRHLAPIVVMLCIVLLVFKTVSWTTDPVKDRTTYPHGLLSYVVRMPDMVLTNLSPISAYLHKDGKIGNVPVRDSFAYLGVAAIIIIITYAIISLLRLLLKKRISFAHGNSYSIWILIATCALLYSMGLPFIWGLDWLYDYVASFRQFRSLDWFALIFYYVFSVFASILLFRFYMYGSENKKYLLTGLAFVALGLWMYEAYAVASRYRERSKKGISQYDYFHGKIDPPWSNFLKSQGYDSGNFQAILMVPYYHVGSEKIWLYESGWGMSIATIASFQLQLPLVDANMSRSSWSQTFKQVKIGGGPFVQKPILDDVKDARPYLLMHIENEQLSPDYRYLVLLSDSIGKAYGMTVYALQPAALRNADNAAREQILKLSESMTEGDKALGNHNLYINHFDDAGSKSSFSGRQAMAALTDKDSMIVSLDVAGWQRDTTYECSAWFLVNGTNYISPELEIHAFDSLWNRLDIIHVPVSTSTDNYKLWFRASAYFRMNADYSVVQVYLKKNKKGVYYAIDELLLRNAADTVISKDYKGRVMVNNHLLY